MNKSLDHPEGRKVAVGSRSLLTEAGGEADRQVKARTHFTVSLLLPLGSWR